MTAGLSRLRAAQRAKSDERFAERVAHQLQQLRAERAPEEPPPIVLDAGNFTRAQVPWAVDLAAAWAWRALVIGAAGYILYRVMAYFSVIFMPLAISLLIAALTGPVVASASKVHMKCWITTPPTLANEFLPQRMAAARISFSKCSPT